MINDWMRGQSLLGLSALCQQLAERNWLALVKLLRLELEVVIQWGHLLVLLVLLSALEEVSLVQAGSSEALVSDAHVFLQLIWTAEWLLVKHSQLGLVEMVAEVCSGLKILFFSASGVFMR